jgi:hypothetical protein
MARAGAEQRVEHRMHHAPSGGQPRRWDKAVFVRFLLLCIFSFCAVAWESQSTRAMSIQLDKFDVLGPEESREIMRLYGKHPV